jgi:hypothetical protein
MPFEIEQVHRDRAGAGGAGFVTDFGWSMNALRAGSVAWRRPGLEVVSRHRPYRLAALRASAGAPDSGLNGQAKSFKAPRRQPQELDELEAKPGGVNT